MGLRNAGQLPALEVSPWICDGMTIRLSCSRRTWNRAVFPGSSSAQSNTKVSLCSRVNDITVHFRPAMANSCRSPVKARAPWLPPFGILPGTTCPTRCRRSSSRARSRRRKYRSKGTNWSGPPAICKARRTGGLRLKANLRHHNNRSRFLSGRVKLGGQAKIKSYIVR